MTCSIGSRCPTCVRTDREYKLGIERGHHGLCPDAWHGDHHLRDAITNQAPSAFDLAVLKERDELRVEVERLRARPHDFAKATWSCAACKAPLEHAGTPKFCPYCRSTDLMRDVAQPTRKPMPVKHYTGMPGAMINGETVYDWLMDDGSVEAMTASDVAARRALAAQPPAAAIDEKRARWCEANNISYDDPTAGPPVQHSSADKAEVSIVPMALSDGRTDYFVQIKVGDRAVTPHVFREEYKSAYHVALYDWLLNGNGEEPDCVEFGPNDWPGRVMPDVPQGMGK